MSRYTMTIWLVVGVIGAALVLTGHGPHVVGYLPFLFLLACPLMHLFMRHHHHGADSPANHSTGAGRNSA